MTPDEIAEKGENIYKEFFQNEYEGEHNGKYLAIDVENKNEYLGNYSEDALINAQNNNPDGLFYLVRIGDKTAFHIGYTGVSSNELERTFQ